jgi:nitrite reductase/ring-hydroxylating ferredoxin subunit/DMSO/TMAO reductase YedYZ heme-binding membrane subunit
LVLLHVVLAIGPLCRIDRRFLPLLYNRRHLGVTMFLLALAHGVFSIVQFHALGDTNPLVSVLSANDSWRSAAAFPFEVLGVAVLVILFVMAATSHDFWLRNLTAPAWKRLHMLVYVAYMLLVAHVAFGALQSERSPWLLVVLSAGAASVIVFHLWAALLEREMDGRDAAAAKDGFVEVCRAVEIPQNRAKVVVLAGERVAVFRYGDCVSAVSNACQHQNGSLGEGRIIDGCITCPWHGYQYRPDDGASPPPFEEKVPTFRVKVTDGRVLVDPTPLPAGTRVEPARVTAKSRESEVEVGNRSFTRA